MRTVRMTYYTNTGATDCPVYISSLESSKGGIEVDEGKDGIVTVLDLANLSAVQ